PADPSFVDAIATMLREARLRGAIVLLEGLDGFIEGATASVIETLARAVAGHRAPVISSGTTPWSQVAHDRLDGLASMVEVDLALPPAELGRKAWQQALDDQGLDPSPDALD